MSGLGPTINDLLKKSKTSKTSSDDTAEEKLEEKLRAIKIADKEKETEAIGMQLGVPYINLKDFPISPDTLALIDEETATIKKVIAFFRSSNELRIGAVDPTSPAVQEIAQELKERLYLSSIIIYIISEHSFQHALKLYKALPKIKKIIKGVKISEQDIKRYKKEIKLLTDLQKIIERAPTTEIVSAIIALALQVQASDIHIEAEEKDVKVRYRIDGMLNDAAILPRETWSKITSRIKLLASLKLNIENKPQDGRFTIFLTNDKIDVRISTIPTAYGESIVMRILKASATGLKFEDLGIRGRAYKEIEEQIHKPNGMIITTGPTGSGKTTTLYAILNKLNKPETKIITLEDPIEYKLEGINQSQIDHSKGYGFAEGLRSILRQDPDIVMVGEIRDLETADVAINAALTGHLVISTLHTNSAAAGIPRFLSMGVKKFLLSPALNAIIGQRLVRKICPACKEEVDLDTHTLEKIMNILKDIPPEAATGLLPEDLTTLKFYKGGGCEECHGIGYKGRIGIYEILIMNKDIGKLIEEGNVSEYSIQETAIKNGMITMVQDGLLKAIDAITTVEEVFRVAKTI